MAHILSHEFRDTLGQGHLVRPRMCIVSIHFIFMLDNQQVDHHTKLPWYRHCLVQVIVQRLASVNAIPTFSNFDGQSTSLGGPWLK